MSEEKKPVEGPDTAALQAKIDALTAERDAAAGQVATLTGERDALTAERDRLTGVTQTYRATLIDLHRSDRTNGLIDPDLAALVPVPELADDGRETEQSRAVWQKWRETKPHLYRQATPTVTAPPVPANTPPLDPGGKPITDAYWRQMAKDDPAKWREQATQSAYLAWCHEQRRK